MSVPLVVDCIGDCWKPAVGGYESGAGRSWTVVLRRPATLQRLRLGTRPSNDLLRPDAGAHRWFRQLVRATHDRCAGHGISAPQQLQLLVTAALLCSPSRVRRQRHGRRYWLDPLSTT